MKNKPAPDPSEPLARIIDMDVDEALRSGLSLQNATIAVACSFSRLLKAHSNPHEVLRGFYGAMKLAVAVGKTNAG